MKTRSGAAWLALTLGVALLPTVGQGQTVDWVQSAGGISIDQARGIAVDAAGNSYVTGTFFETAAFGPFSVTSSGREDIFVAKYDGSGNVLWVRSAGATQSDESIGIAVDALSNSYITGFYVGTVVFGSFPLTSAGGGNAFVVKYDSSGNVLWAQSAGGTSGAAGGGIGVDATGNAYVTGGFGDTATFGSLSVTSAGSTDVFVAKYDASGNVVWARSGGGTAHETGFGIAVDAAGNSYVTGDYRDTAAFGPFILTSAGLSDIFVCKYDTGGNVLWARSAGGTEGDGASRIAIDTDGNSYVTGGYQSVATFGPFTLTSAGSFDIFVAKYDTEGVVLWAQSAGGISMDEFGTDIGVDAAGNSYVTGIFVGTAEFGPFTLTSAGGRDIFVAKYDGGGNVVWVRSAGGTAFDQGNAIAVDDVGTSYVSGRYAGTATFGALSLTSAGSSDIFVAKYGVSACNNGSVDPDEECDGGIGCTDCHCDADFESTTPPSLDCQPICGNGSVDPGEECDGGVGCTDCRCDADFEPTVPPSLDCQPTCGNGSVDPGEECDGGLGCTDCSCDADFEPTALPSLDCQPTCGNGSVDPGEECDGGFGCTDCLCDANFEPAAPPSLDCQPICGNGSLDPGEECDGMDDAACPGACLTNCICPESPDPFCGDGVCDPNEDSCNCPGDCGTPVQSEIPGSTCTDGLDNDCDGDVDCRDPDCDDDPACDGVPTVSQWGMAVLVVLLLVGIAMKFRRSRTT